MQGTFIKTSLASTPAVPCSPLETVSAGSLLQIASFTSTHSKGFGFHIALQERRMHLLWRRGPERLRCVCVTGAGCVPVSNRACYLCRLGRSYNRRHRTQAAAESLIWSWPLTSRSLHRRCRLGECLLDSRYLIQMKQPDVWLRAFQAVYCYSLVGILDDQEFSSYKVNGTQNVNTDIDLLVKHWSCLQCQLQCTFTRSLHEGLRKDNYGKGF